MKDTIIISAIILAILFATMIVLVLYCKKTLNRKG